LPNSRKGIREQRLNLLENHYTPVPLVGKKPGTNNWQAQDVDRSAIGNWDSLAHLTNTGIRCGAGEAIGLDIDIDDPFFAAAVSTEIRQELDNTPLERVGREPRSLLPYRTKESFRKKKLTFTLKGLDQKIEVLAQGQQFAAYGIHPDTKKDYRWLGEKNPLNTPIDELPLITEAEVDQCLSRLEELLESMGATNIQRHAANSSRRAKFRQVNGAGLKNPMHPDYMRAALEYLDADDYDDEWIPVGMAIHYETNGSPDGLALWDEWSQKSGKYDETRQNECEYKWQSFSGSENPVTAASIIYSARKNGFDPSKYIGPRELLPIAKIRSADGQMGAGHSAPKKNFNVAPVFPEELLDPPGLVGSIAQYCNQSSIRDQPLLDICAGLMTVSTLSENRFLVGRSEATLNIYLVAVAETGEGKEAPRKAIKSLLKEAGKLSVVKESASSAPAVLRRIAGAARKNLTLLMDEFGRFLSVASRPNNGHQYELVSEYMRLYGQANSTYVGRVYADEKDNIPPIDRPFVNIFGTTTERSLIDAISNKDVLDGHLNRMLVVHMTSRSPDFRDDPNPSIDDDLRKYMVNLLRFEELEWSEEAEL